MRSPSESRLLERCSIGSTAFLRFLVWSCVASAIVSAATPTLVQSFSFLNFTFRSSSEAQTYIDNRHYASCMPAGIKLNSMGDIFISVPRWQPHVPATLSKLRPDGLLEPFPSWEMNAIGNVTALQSVLGFEIDDEDVMYVLDQGKVAGNASLPGAIKLLFLDAVTGETLRSPIIFDESVASLSSSFLNDVVVDKLNNFLYITDSGLQVNASLPLQGGLLVVDLSTNQVRRLLDRHPSVQNDLSFWLTINGERVLHDSPIATGADGIALSCDASTLYYTPLSSETLYSIPTSVLRDQTMALDSIPQAVNKIGYKLGASDGFAYSSAGYLYLTDISNSAILRSRDRKFVHQADFVTEVTDPVLMQWPDTMAFDNMGSLYFVSNRLHRFQMGELNFSDVNYHIWKIPVEGRSYIFGCDPLSSRRKDSSDSDGWTMVSMPIWAFLLVIVGMLAVGMLCFWMISKLRRQAVRRRRPRSSSSSRKVRFGEEGEEETDRSNSLTRPLNQD